MGSFYKSFDNQLIIHNENESNDKENRLYPTAVKQTFINVDVATLYYCNFFVRQTIVRIVSYKINRKTQDSRQHIKM